MVNFSIHLTDNEWQLEYVFLQFGQSPNFSWVRLQLSNYILAHLFDFNLVEPDKVVDQLDQFFADVAVFVHQVILQLFAAD